MEEVMANHIGTVQSVTGIVKAVAEDGSDRILSVGDSVFENEKVMTGDGIIVITFSNGTVMDLASNSSIVLDEDVFNFDGELRTQNRLSAEDEVAALQDALIDSDFDPTTELLAPAAGTPAAGEIGDNNGHSIVSVDYLNPKAPVTSGHDTTGISQEFLQPDEELPPVEDEPEKLDEVPTISVTSGMVDERGLETGTGELSDGDATNNSDGSETTTGMFTYDVGSNTPGQIEVQGKDGAWVVVSNGSVIQGNNGVLTISESGGVYSWGYTLENNVMHAGTNVTGVNDQVLGESFSVRVSGSNPKASAMTKLDIAINDDGPILVKGQSSAEASEFTIVNHDEVSSAGYHNSYGYYVKTLNPDGTVSSNNPTSGVIIAADVHHTHAGFDPITVTGYSQEQIGYFLIPNGDQLNKIDNNQTVTFQEVGGQWQAFAGATPLLGRGSHVLFDLAELNKDGQNHMEDNVLLGNQNWEDLQIPYGDGDYNDVNTNVDWTKVTVTGDVVESVSFGADGPGAGEALNFTFDVTDIESTGVVKSNGNDIVFKPKDTDDDGVNDQIVGLADGDEVLRIDGILEGDYQISILGPIDDGADDVDVGIDVHVTASDGDGDMVASVLNVNINFDLNQVLSESEPMDLP
jgi:hypothetical protein